LPIYCYYTPDDGLVRSKHVVLIYELNHIYCVWWLSIHY
jgi:hypothetical protein